MEKQKIKWGDILLRVLSYVLVAAVSAGLVFWLMLPGQSKLLELESIIQEYFIDIDDVDMVKVEDAAAAAMVEALGNQWSFYIPADQYAEFMADQQNAYVGIGITIQAREDKTGFDIIKVEPAGGAAQAGIQAGDILTHVEGKAVDTADVDATTALVQGEVGSKVKVTVLRGGESLEFSVERREILITVAAGQMLPDNIGLITINNFNERCADEVIGTIEDLVDQGAEALIFDVRYNPGGYKEELVEILDYLLPEGNLFRSRDYAGKEEIDKSDKKCLKLPMAVLINKDSYSAAEFFAAALEEYDWAVTVGENTTGKSHFQYAIPLSDGSAVNLSVGKYLTPKGVSLADVGGLVANVQAAVDEKTYSAIYYDQVPVEEDPQIQAAVEALKTAN